jgi:hypothetical protein
MIGKEKECQEQCYDDIRAGTLTVLGQGREGTFFDACPTTSAFS